MTAFKVSEAPKKILKDTVAIVPTANTLGWDRMDDKFVLNDGVEIPAVGFGTFQIPADGSTYKAVAAALKDGYRHIDTAAAYFNEAEVGKAVRDSGLDREEVFVTSKLWLQDYGYEPAKKGIQTSLDNLGLDYMDLYLLHQPYGDVEGAWQALEDAKEEGQLRSIGISNMTPTIYRKFVPKFRTKPSVNQVECNPFFQQKPLRKVMEKDKVRIECWGPLGRGNSALLTNPIISNIGARYGKNCGQVILRFLVQEGFIVLPKSVHEERIKSNLDIFDFKLTEDEMERIGSLDTGKGTHDPDAPGVGEYLMSAFKVHD